MKKQPTPKRKRTIFQRIFLRKPNEGHKEPKRCQLLKSMIGQEFETITDLSPAGFIFGPDKKLIDAISLGPSISAGQKVRVIRTEGWAAVFVIAVNPVQP